MNALIAAVGLIVAFLIGIFFSKKTSQTDAQVIDLTNKVAQKQKEVDDKQAAADKAIKDYENSLKDYKPPTT